jgi:hypothetical protein
MALEGPSFLPFNASTFSAATTSITFGLVLYQRWFLLHEVMSPGIMVCVTLILKTFEYVNLIPFVSNKHLDLILVHLTMMTGCSSKPVPIGFELPLGGFLKSHCPLPSYYHFSILLPAHPPHFICLGIGLANHLRVAPCLVGRRG